MIGLAPTHARISMPFAEWPERDRLLWIAAMKTGEFGDKITILAGWSEDRTRGARLHYGAWLEFIFKYDSSCLSQAPEERMTRTLLVKFLRPYRERVAAMSLAGCIGDLYGVMVSIASDSDWLWLKRLRAAAYSHARAQPKKICVFTHADELLMVGRMLLKAAYDNSRKIVDLLSFRDGLIIIMLTMIPARITQFSKIEIGKHLTVDEKGKYCLHWGALETKTRRNDNYPVISELAELLNIYLNSVRPILLAPRKKGTSTDLLWVNNVGRSLGSQPLRKIIKARTAAIIGRAINPHAFRSSAATTYVLEAPKYASEAGALLSHSSFETTKKYYLAGRRVQALEVSHAALKKWHKVGGPIKGSNQGIRTDEI